MKFQNVLNVKKNKQTYKFIIFKYLFGLLLLFFLIIGLYSYYNYKENCEQNARNKAQATVDRMVSQIDEKLNYLKMYYVAMENTDEMRWMMDNDIIYSDYSKYKAAYDGMNSKSIFTGYLSGFSFINYKTDWVLSNKGLFHTEEISNKESLREFIDYGPDERTYWNYINPVKNSVVKPINRYDRTTITIDGFSFVMKLPSNSINTYAYFIANINMATWRKWITDFVDLNEYVMVTDGNKLIYDTFGKWDGDEWKNLVSGKYKYNKLSYIVEEETSYINGWKYYVITQPIATDQSIVMPLVMYSVTAVFVIICFFVVSVLIYSPVNKLVKSISDSDSVDGNELEFLEGSYRSLEENKQELETLVDMQHDRLKELFEVRLIHGEVKSDEWAEYIERFKMIRHKYFATIVAILNVTDDEMQNMVNEDAVCLKILEELPESTKSLAWMPPIYDSSTVFAIFSEDDEETLFSVVKEFYKELCECGERVGEYKLQMGVSASHTDYKHVRVAYRESINALTFKAFSNVGNSEDAGEGCSYYIESKACGSVQYDSHFEKDIQNAIKAVDKKMCYDVVDSFSVFIKEYGRKDELTIYVLRFVNTIFMTAIDAGVEVGVLYPDGIKKLYNDLFSVEEPDRIRRNIKRFIIDPLLEYRTEYLKNHSHSMLEQIENTIAEKKGNITLTECADELGVNTTYIWKVLKMERDRSFSDYVEEYKLSEAKRLLLETNMTVAEIAEQLNYTNAQNFIRFFSKSTGVTPGKFRKLN